MYCYAPPQGQGVCCSQSGLNDGNMCDHCYTCIGGQQTPNMNGTCAPVQQGHDPNNYCPGGATCDGAGKCTCGNGTQTCGGTCASKCNEGTPCMGGGDCVSGQCVDNVCCLTGCGGACQSCALTFQGHDYSGTCTPLPVGATCDKNGNTCDDMMNCKQQNGGADGSTCSRGSDCVTNNCQNKVCVPSNEPTGYPCVPMQNECATACNGITNTCF